LRQLFGFVTPQTATVADTLIDVFGIESANVGLARSLSARDVEQLHAALLQRNQPAAQIGFIGNVYRGQYHRIAGTAAINGAKIPYTVECWADCQRAERNRGSARIELLVNRSPSLGKLYAASYATGLELFGCALKFTAEAAKTARYRIKLSIIAPYIRLTNDGKSPLLADFNDACSQAIRRVAAAAYRAMARPPRQMSQKDAAWKVMETAYREVSANPGGRPLPANARQIMYKARPQILKLTGSKELNDSYFTQQLLPDFLTAHPNLCADWDVVYDARGHLQEPHTRRSVPLGTLQVRQYLGQRPDYEPTAQFPINVRYPTRGPLNRYRNLLFIEKEGFDSLIEASRLRERFDIVTASSKGMSVTALRELIDGLMPELDCVFTLHDFDISGFTIAGTLTSDGRRYTYDNEVNVVDLGLRLEDIAGLPDEPVDVKGSRDEREATLRGHGATAKEIGFLLGLDGTGQPKRVELNAMTSRQLIDFIERKLKQHGVKKVVPEAAVLLHHARRLIEQKIIQAEVEKMGEWITTKAQETALPKNLGQEVRSLLNKQPSLAWDQAVALALGMQEG
jgi:hypothetical protein